MRAKLFLTLCGVATATGCLGRWRGPHPSFDQIEVQDQTTQLTCNANNLYEVKGRVIVKGDGGQAQMRVVGVVANDNKVETFEHPMVRDTHGQWKQTLYAEPRWQYNPRSGRVEWTHVLCYQFVVEVAGGGIRYLPPTCTPIVAGPPTEIILSSDNVEICVGEAFTVRADPRDANNCIVVRDVTWSKSGGIEIRGHDGNTVVFEGTTPGDASITASVGAVTEQLQVNVTRPTATTVSNVSKQKDENGVWYGTTALCVAGSGSEENVSVQIDGCNDEDPSTTWESSDASVVSLLNIADPSGKKLVAWRAGQARITVRVHGVVVAVISVVVSPSIPCYSCGGNGLPNGCGGVLSGCADCTTSNARFSGCPDTFWVSSGNPCQGQPGTWWNKYSCSNGAQVGGQCYGDSDQPDEVCDCG